MDTPMITALAAASGSIAGAIVTGFVAWNTQRMQTLRELTQAGLRERRTLYGEFITEASRLVVDAVSHSLETAEKLVILYGILGRIRLVSSGKVLAEAERCVLKIVELYESPNLTVEQVRASLQSDDFDPLTAFSSVCRAELLAIAPTFGRLERIRS
jgi:hypothetical protein